MRVKKASGYTLVELLVVIGIIGLIAMIAVPKTSSNDANRLAIAASEFANAIRYARTEAMRLDQVHGFTLTPAGKSLRLYRLDSLATPPAQLYDIRHPISKQLYQVDIDAHPFASADTVQTLSSFRGSCNNAREVQFDAHGTAWCVDPDNVPLQQIDITVLMGGSSLVVSVDGITGRVTVK